MQKILVFDIENTPAKVYTWGMFEQNVVKVLEQPFMLSVAHQWLGEETKVVALPDFCLYKRDKHDDRALIKYLWELINEADVVLGQNSDNFDLKFFNTRCIVHHLPPPSPYKTIDTLKISKSKFRWLSNKLDFVSDQLGHGKKAEHEGFPLWEKCMAGDMKAWKVMKEYNKRDVDITAKVFNDYLPWISQTAPVWNNKKTCPHCGSTNTQRRGFNRSKKGIFQRFTCLDCFGWFTGAKVLNRLSC